MRRILLSLFLSLAACSSPAVESADPDLARPPARPETVAAANEVRWFVIDSFTLDWQDAKAVGYDLDGVATTVEESRAGRGLCRRKPDSASSVLSDGERGIDNSVGRDVLALFKSLIPEFATETNARIARGKYTVALRLENVGPDDNGHVPGALWLVGERANPRFAPDETWPVAGTTMLPLQLFPDGYMRDGVWVSTDRRSARASVPVPMFGDALVFPFERAVISVHVADGQNGVIAGAVRANEFRALVTPSLIGKGLCADDPWFEHMMNAIVGSSDIALEGDGECDALSAGIGFTMKPIAGIEGNTGEPPAPIPSPACADGNK